MLIYVYTNDVIGGVPDGGGGIGTNELPDAITLMICELRLCTEFWSTTGFLSLSGL